MQQGILELSMTTIALTLAPMSSQFVLQNSPITTPSALVT